MTEIIQLISGPRNISTALMYSFANREDTAVVDEPFYAYYLSNFDVDHPGAKEVLKEQSSNPEQVKENILFAEREEPYLFVKNMAHHMDGYDYSYSREVRNVFLIREPKRLIASFAKVIHQPKGSDLGLKREAEIYTEIINKSKYKPVVLDSGELLKDPHKVIQQLCGSLDIPFDRAMLSWKPGPRLEDGSWAKFWYHNVHQSTGFIQQNPKDIELEDHLVPVYEEVLPYYKLLFKQAIKA